MRKAKVLNMVRTESLDLDARFGEEYQGHYVFKELFWAKRSRIIQKHTTYNMTTGSIQKSDFVAIQAETVMASIHGQPQNKPITLEKLLGEDEQGVPYELGELFSKISNRLNSVAREDLRFLLEQLDEECRIQLLQSLGFVKSSAGPQQSSPGNQQELLSSSS